MPDDPNLDEATQSTPKGTTIPVPTREQVVEGLKKIAKPITKSSNDGSAEK
jgi:hypothetical protein